MRRFPRPDIPYMALLAGAFALSLVASWAAVQVDDMAYDWFFRLYRPAPWQTETALLAIDEESLAVTHGLRNLRAPLAQALEIVAAAHPRAVAIDIILTDPSDEPTDAALERAFSREPHLVLSSKLLASGPRWEEPLPRFARWAAGIGHVHAEPDRLDSVSRALPLEKQGGRVRRWALALETLRVSRGAAITESPDDLRVGKVVIPARIEDGRAMRIRYVPPNMDPIPSVSLVRLLADPALAARFSGKVVFVGVTDQAVVHDWLFTPYSHSIPVMGLEIHANAFETMAQQRFLTDAPEWAVVGFSALLVAGAGAAFGLAPLWLAYLIALLLLAAAHVTPYLAFTRGEVFSFATPVASAWFGSVTAAAWQHLVVRRRLRRAEADRARYQQTMHFVTHEMRTPLTAIQGSSELMTRFALPADKRQQMAELINAESKRLGRMIEIFLNVERLSAGEVELRRENFPVAAMVEACLGRARPLAERKQIRVNVEPLDAALVLTGDRELMEYAFYNLVTNAIKYSPQRTEVSIGARREDHRVRVWVRDQGIGMDQKEIRNIFKKFYRTKRAEQSGEKGTGIGLSIVEQIIAQHGGTIEVASRPGEGSCFTLVLPPGAPAVVTEQS
jgi:signal transduction histidine kinase